MLQLFEIDDTSPFRGDTHITSTLRGDGGWGGVRQKWDVLDVGGGELASDLDVQSLIFY